MIASLSWNMRHKCWHALSFFLAFMEYHSPFFFFVVNNLFVNGFYYLNFTFSQLVLVKWLNLNISCPSHSKMKGAGRVIVSSSIEVDSFLKARKLVEKGVFKSMSDFINTAMKEKLKKGETKNVG